MQDKILKYIDLLKAYNEHTNIYSRKSYDKLNFHIEDSLTLASLIGNRVLRLADFGSGSGLPSIILAISNPKNAIFAIESKSRKTRFLNQVVSALNLTNLTVINANLYEWVRQVEQPFDVITAKAFGSVEKISDIAKSIIVKGHSRLYIPFSSAQADSVEPSLIIKKDVYTYYYSVF